MWGYSESSEFAIRFHAQDCSSRVAYGFRIHRWHEPTRGKTLKEEEVIYKKEWQFLTEELAKMKTYTLEAGNHEYPFEVVLPGNQAESVEGLRDANIVYRMKATIERPKYWKRPITAKKHLRIVRTLSPGSLELSSTMVLSPPNERFLSTKLTIRQVH